MLGMKSLRNVCVWALLSTLLSAGELPLSGFRTAEAAQGAGWSAQSTAVMSMPEPGVLRVVGMDRKPYCGLRLNRELRPDGAGAITFEVRMNFGPNLYLGMSTQAGYYDIYTPVRPHEWQTVTVPLDVARWRFHGSGAKPAQWGRVSSLSILVPTMKKSDEVIEIRHVRFAEATPVAAVPAAPAADAPMLKTALAEYWFDAATGALSAVRDRRSGAWVVHGTENRYFIYRKSGDADASERHDRVVNASRQDDTLEFECVNPGLPQMKIRKRYRRDGERLRRDLIFSNGGQDTAYLTPRTRVRFTPDFYRGGFYLGSGYIGPLTPVPVLDAPQKEVRSNRPPRVCCFITTARSAVLRNIEPI